MSTEPPLMLTYTPLDVLDAAVEVLITIRSMPLDVTVVLVTAYAVPATATMTPTATAMCHRLMRSLRGCMDLLLRSGSSTNLPRSRRLYAGSHAAVNASGGRSHILPLSGRRQGPAVGAEVALVRAQRDAVEPRAHPRRVRPPRGLLPLAGPRQRAGGLPRGAPRGRRAHPLRARRLDHRARARPHPDRQRDVPQLQRHGRRQRARRDRRPLHVRQRLLRQRRQPPLRRPHEAGDVSGLHDEGPDADRRQRVVRNARRRRERSDGRRALRHRRQQRRDRGSAAVLDRRGGAGPGGAYVEALSGDLARLLVSCPDRPGIVAAVSRFLFERGANIVSSDPHSTDPHDGTFYLRVAFTVDGLAVSGTELAETFARDVAEPFAMTWRLRYVADVPRVAIMVSREDHCLLDLLWRWRRGELDADVGLVISNHPDQRADVEGFGVRYEHVPVPPGGKPAAEERALELLRGCDLVVLARYMQILSGDFLARLGVPVINIHHSFLPAFAGAQPYQRAAERGVKIIGATAHYVTEELDAGPIIEQDIERVSHRENADALARIGRDVERVVLARAVKWHLDDRVLVDGARTVVF